MKWVGAVRPRAIWILIAIYVAIAALYVWSVPIWEATDEEGHFAYAMYLREHRSLPIQPADAQHLVLSHWFHPPLYYTLAALVTAPIDTSDFPSLAKPNPHFVWVQGDAPGGWNVFLPVRPTSFPPRGTILAVYLLRILSVAMGAAIVWLAHDVAYRLVPKSAELALGAAALTAFNPSFIYMTSGVHNDTLVSLLGTAILWWAITTATRRPPGRLRLILGGLLLGLALLTKTSALALAPIVLLALLAAAIPSRLIEEPRDAIRLIRLINRPIVGETARRFLARVGLTLGVTLVVAGWWYARNATLYGDPLAWQRYLITHAFLVRSGPYDFAAFRAFASQLARTYWAAFGYMNLVVDQRIYVVIWIAVIIAALGLARSILTGALWRVVSSRWVGWVLATVCLCA